MYLIHMLYEYIVHMCTCTCKGKQIFPVNSKLWLHFYLFINSFTGYSALHYAVLKNNSDAVKMLQESGADMNRIVSILLRSAKTMNVSRLTGEI